MKEMANVPTYKRLTRMVQVLRGGFVGAGGVFLAWHLVELGMGLAEVDADFVAELMLVAGAGPLFVWFGGQRILGLVVEVEARSRELHALNRMSQEIFAESLETKENMDEMLEACQLCKKVTTAVGETTAEGSVPVEGVLDAVVTVMKMDMAELWVVSPTGPEVQLVSQRGLVLDALRERTSFPVGEGFPGLAVQTRAPVVSNDAANDARLVMEGLKLTGFTAFVAVPLLLKDGEVMGAVTAGTRSRGIGAAQVSHLQETMSSLAPLLRRLVSQAA